LKLTHRTGKGKGQLVTSNEGTEGEQRYISTLSLTSPLDGVCVCVCGQLHAALAPRERDPVPILQEVGWAPGPVWTGAPTGILSPDCPARSELPHHLNYPSGYSCSAMTSVLFNL